MVHRLSEGHTAKARHVTASHTIRKRIERRLNRWEAGRHGILVEEILRTCAQYLTVAHREETNEHRAKTYHILVIQGKLKTAVRWITERGTGGSNASRGTFHQNQGEVSGGAAHQTSGSTPPVCGHPGHISIPTTGACPSGHYGRHGDIGSRTPLRSYRAGGDGLGESTPLAPGI